MITPLNGNVLVRMNVERGTSKYSDIVLPDNVRQKHTSIATVIAVSRQAEAPPYDLYIGAQVIMPEAVRGQVIREGNVVYHMAHVDNIVAVLE